jgi:hypothetical protein
MNRLRTRARLANLTRFLYWAARRANDLRELSAGDPRKIARRAVSKAIGRKVVRRSYRGRRLMDALAIEERLNRLEKENKRLRLLALGVVVLAGGSLLLAAATGVRALVARPGRIVEAEGFVLRDASGKTRAALVMTAAWPGLALDDASGKPGAALQDLAGGPSLTLQDSQGFQAVIGHAALHTPSTGEQSTTSAASIHLFDKAGNVIWAAP